MPLQPCRSRACSKAEKANLRGRGCTGWGEGGQRALGSPVPSLVVFSGKKDKGLLVKFF